MIKTSLSQFYAELKRRKVIRVAIAYVVIAWLIVEVASVMFPGLLLPDWSVRLVIGLAILGFPIALAPELAEMHASRCLARRSAR